MIGMRSTLIEERFSAHPKRVAWQGRGWSRSFEMLAADVSRLRIEWRAEGLKPGKRVAFYSQDTYISWVASLAAFGEGASIGLIPPRLKGEQIEPYLAQLPFHFWAGTLPSPSAALPALSYPELSSAGFAEPRETLAIDPERPALLIFSSGSSGQPKAIEHSFKSLASSALATLEFYQDALNGAESWLLSLDLAHIGGWQIALRCLLGGIRCISGYAPHEVELALSSEPIDALSLVPTQLWRCLETRAAELRQARLILLGGAPCPPELLAAARDEALPVSITYGSSETASQLAAFLPGDLPQEATEVGSLLPHWEATLYDKRLALRGPALCRGYWQAGVFHPALQKLEPHGTKLWFLSADWAELKGQDLKILGRADQIFQVGGENLAPEEISRALTGLKAPGDWIIVPRADAELGAVPLLIYRSAEAPPPREAILGALRARLPGIKLPRALYWHRSSELSKPSRQLYLALLSSPEGMELMWNL